MIYIKYNMTLTDLLRAVKHYELDADDEVKALRTLHGQTRANKMKGVNKMQALTPEQEHTIENGVRQSGPIAPLQGGLLTFGSILKLYGTITQLNMRIIEENSIRFKTDRRALLADKKEKEYQELIKEYTTKMNMTASAVKKQVFKLYGVSMGTYEEQIGEVMKDR